MRPSVLVIQHEPGCPPVRFGEWLGAEGCRLDVVRAWEEPLPPLREYDGLLVLGGSMDADDDARCPWLPGVRALIRGAADAGVPTLGICLGHQLAALALGGEVARNPYGRTRGLRQVDWDPEVIFDPLVSTIAGEDRAVHWNQDVVTRLPEGAALLASTLDGAVQAARFAPTVWGVQFHPEADLAVVAGWAEHDRPAAALGENALGDNSLGEDDIDARLRDIEDAMPELAETWVRLAAAFARHARGRAAARELFGG